MEEGEREKRVLEDREQHSSSSSSLRGSPEKRIKVLCPERRADRLSSVRPAASRPFGRPRGPSSTRRCVPQSAARRPVRPDRRRSTMRARWVSPMRPFAAAQLCTIYLCVGPAGDLNALARSSAIIRSSAFSSLVSVS